MLTCHGCGQPVVYDEETKLHHCGKCIRVGERVEWCGLGLMTKPRMTGTVTAYDLNAFDGDRVRVLWDHRTDGVDHAEARKYLRHINALDQIVEALDDLDPAAV